jgi:hypothetical protein
MTNRREVIQAGIAVSAISVTGAAVHAAEAATAPLSAAPGLRLDGLVFDRRFEQAAEIARSAERYGVPAYETDGDAADIYYHHLRKLWRGPHAAFAGVTSVDTTFVFQTLAADHRLRLIYRGLHEAPEAGAVAHVLSGPATMIDTAGLGDYRGQWLQRVGYLMTHAAAGGPVKTINLTTDAEHTSGRQHPLVSWIVAPASWNLAAVGLRTLMGCGGMLGHMQG